MEKEKRTLFYYAAIFFIAALSLLLLAIISQDTFETEANTINDKLNDQTHMTITFKSNLESALEENTKLKQEINKLNEKINQINEENESLTKKVYSMEAEQKAIIKKASVIDNLFGFIENKKYYEFYNMLEEKDLFISKQNKDIISRFGEGIRVEACKYYYNEGIVLYNAKSYTEAINYFNYGLFCCGDQMSNYKENFNYYIKKCDENIKKQVSSNKININGGKTMFYAGTYTWSGKSKGIYICNFDMESGEIKILGNGELIDNPSYLTYSKEKNMLFASIEAGQYNGEKGGAVATYKTYGAELKLLNTMSTGGGGTCHVSLDNNSSYLFAANYNDGNGAVFKIGENGLSERTDTFAHSGNSVNKSRQEKAHAHYAIITPDQKYLCVVDLGIDAVVIYNFDKVNGKISEKGKFKVTVPGQGPRHMTFDKSGKFAYLVHELTSQVSVLTYDDGNFNEIQCLSTLPEDFKDQSTCAAIKISNDGKRLFASNRGHDSIAVFSILENGRLKLLSVSPSGGKNPRDFGFIGNDIILIAHQDSDSILTYKISETGDFEKFGEGINIPSPVCVCVI